MTSMSPEKWERVSEIYHSALELKPDERNSFLDTACAGDDFLRREVESLLAANSAAGSFIVEPVVRDISPLLTIDSAPPSSSSSSSFLRNSSLSLTGKILGHYRVVSRIGVGGMGEVYLARDTKLNRRVALKFLPAQAAGDPNYLRRFQIEAKASATLNHPNVAIVYSVEDGFDGADGRPFITMEYVEGKTLDTFIPAGGLNLKTFLEWFVQLADALAHAHDKGVTHRDIKPGNIMITPEGVPKILDFGLAQIDRSANPAAAAEKTEADDTSTLNMTDPGQVFGTPSYMSPEQAEGKPVDRRSDIFSFGVVMYQALTGERPFKGDSYASVVSELMTKEPRPITEIKPGTPFLLARLVMRCLCKERRKRFQSMREVRAILEEIKSAVEDGVSLDSFSLSFLRTKQPEASRAWLIVPALFLILAAAAAIYYFVQQNPPAEPLNFASMTLRKLSQTNNVAFVQITPDGKSIVYITLDESNTRSLWIRRVEDKSAPLRLLSKEFRQFWGGIAVSPDGSQIYYILADENAREGTLYRISSLGGAPRKLIEKANDVGDVSADGQRILFARHGERTEILTAGAADGGDERVIHTLGPNEFIRDPKFSADGRKVFFSKRESIDGRIFWSLVEIPADGSGGGATGAAERKILEANGERIGELAVLKNGRGILINKSDRNSNLQQIFFVSLPAGKERRVTNDLNSYHGVGVSDDGSAIVTTQRLTTADIWLTEPEERRLTRESNVASRAVFTPDGRIVYDASDNNRPQIWIMNADGSNAQQLTPNDSYNSEPQVSPDGRFIVFTSNRTGEGKIWRMNIDGTNPTLLTDVAGSAFAPVVAADSTVWFRWSRENKQTLARVSLAGGQVSEQPEFGGYLWAISPDAKQVAVAYFDAPDNRLKVRVRPIDAEEPSKIFDIAPSGVLKWTIDGKNLLYRSLDSSPETPSIIWKQPLSGGAPTQVLSVSPDRVTGLSQSADGKQTLIIRGKILTDAIMLSFLSDEEK
jgi:eukaryotic-like serine/threonine-protein kinase